MNRAELKNWAKEKIKPRFWFLLAVLLVSSVITNLSYVSFSYTSDGQITSTSYSFGWLFYFVEVGTTYFMVNFINDKSVEFKDIFRFSSDFVRCVCTILLQALYVLLYCLLLIVPGIIKSYSYALVPYLMADDKYKDLKAGEILKKSEAMMNGHKMDLFMLGLSFFGWYLLGILTCGIGFIYVIPYVKTTTTKFLYDIKVQNEK
jgi:uncharacterized membrane protein